MRVLYKGAESIICVGEWEGEKVIIKERVRKGYRIRQVDSRLRRVRTRREVRLMREARKCGVATPRILHVDEEKQAIVMEFLEGGRLKELLSLARPETVRRLCRQVGRLLGRLHTYGIVHGDPTTSNMIACKGRIYLIDFGLGGFSKRIEDQAVDMNLLYQALRSTHFKALGICWTAVTKGYRESYERADEVLSRAQEIERRARYMARQ
jgi:Kae1-associated kinase Bud32